ncbi:hypothetical protein Tco_0068918, partial [Tanacetum coccineum]
GSVHTDIWGWRYEVYTQRSLNTLTQIVVKEILVAEVNFSVSNSGLKDVHQRTDGFSFVTQ